MSGLSGAIESDVLMVDGQRIRDAVKIRETLGNVLVGLGVGLALALLLKHLIKERIRCPYFLFLVICCSGPSLPASFSMLGFISGEAGSLRQEADQHVADDWMVLRT